MHLLHLTIWIDPKFNPWKLGCPMVLENLLNVTFKFFFFFLGGSKFFLMLGTVRTSTPTYFKLKAPIVPKVDALCVVLVDLPSEVQGVVG